MLAQKHDLTWGSTDPEQVLAYSRYLSSVSSLPSALVKTCQGGSFLMYESFLGPGDAGVMLWMCNNNTRRPTADEI